MDILDYSAEDFQKVCFPTMILLGACDEYIPVEIGVEMYQMLSKGELAIVPNAKHNFPWQNSKKMLNWKLIFLPGAVSKAILQVNDELAFKQ